MKNILLSAVAATLVVSPTLAAAPASAAQRYDRSTIHNNRDIRQQAQRHTNVRQTTYYARTTYRSQPRVTYRQTYRPSYHAWNRGERFDRRYAANYRTISNYRDYRLQTPPRGYQWEQSGNDAVLVAITSGLIGAIIGNAIR